MDGMNMFPVLDSTYKELTSKFLNVKMQNVGFQDLKNGFNEGNTSSAVVTTFGDYRISFIFCATVEVMQGIASRMKRERVEDIQELKMYVREYLNILCGRVITIVNNSINKKVKFKVPVFIYGCYTDDMLLEDEYKHDFEARAHFQEQYYECEYGITKLMIVYHDIASYNYLNF